MYGKIKEHKETVGKETESSDVHKPVDWNALLCTTEADNTEYKITTLLLNNISIANFLYIE